jgi:hypothetical protein
MFENLTNLGWGVVTFAITIGVGTTVLTKFAGAVSECPTAYGFYDGTSDICAPTNGTGLNITGAGKASLAMGYLNRQLGTTGLAGWTPAIIAFAVGMLFLGAFLIGKGGSRRY